MRAFTFDFDGTLANTAHLRVFLLPVALRHPAIVGALQEGFEELRGSRARDLDGELCRRVATRAGCSPTTVARVLHEQVDLAWARSFRHARPPPGLLELIERIDERRLPRAVLSDHPTTERLRAMPVPALRPHRWSLIVSCRALGALKPLPDGLHAAAAGLGLPASALIHIGDRPETDGAMAAAAGAHFVDVRDGSAIRALLRSLD